MIDIHADRGALGFCCDVQCRKVKFGVGSGEIDRERKFGCKNNRRDVEPRTLLQRDVNVPLARFDDQLFGAAGSGGYFYLIVHRLQKYKYETYFCYFCSMKLLEIDNLHASVEGREILKGIDLSVGAGEVHAIMGPNGSGKSTLASTLAGNPRYEVTGGSVMFDGRDLLPLNVEQRAQEGIFLGFQYPVEIAGVSMANFMKAAMAEKRKHAGLEPLTAAEFLKLVREKAALVELDPAMISRSVNEGFSGGEKKKNEIFQMAMLSPRLALLDETDSGLDIDALRIVGSGVSKLRSKDNAIVLITHYQRLLDYIVPDFVHVLYKGKIIESGGRELALKLEKEGYDWLIK